MSLNYIFYAEKMLEIQAARRLGRPLQCQLEELLRFIQECEAKWRLNDRADTALRRPQIDI
jgi:hypothetical protein